MKESFVHFLQEELVRRSTRNGSYSLRSFAEALGIGSSDLSKILNRRRALTLPMYMRLAKQLDLDPEKIEHYRQDLVLEGRSRKGASKASSDKLKPIDLDTFHVLADWYHFAILELLKVRNFKPTIPRIAKALDISVNEANIAVQRLQRLGFLSITKKGTWLDRAGATTSVNEEYTDMAKKRLQRQILEKAALALEHVPLSARDQSAMLMAVSTKHLPAAKVMIREFRRNLSSLMEAGTKKDQVYFLSVSLFPVLDPKSLEEFRS